jgi:hyaluronoglucosaminidase
VGAFAIRGVVEGFYGPAWSHADRLWWLERLGRWGMNRYVYAPKDDRLQREAWRIPYPDERLRELRELVERGARAGVEVGFSVSPGLSIEYASAADLEALVSKLRAFEDLGSGFLSLGLDDVPSRLVHARDRQAFPSLADAHVALAHAVAGALRPETRLWLVPTDYMGVEPSDYLEVLGSRLDPAVLVGWTGRTVVSPTIGSDEAAARAATLERPLLVWDNYPVADGPMRPVLHLGPYVGRDPGLPRHVTGVLLNPMQHAHASALAVRTAAAYLRDPEGYEPEAAWEEACRELGAGAEAAFRTFAAAHRFSALAPDDRDAELESALEALRRDDALQRFEALLEERLAAGDAIHAHLADRTLAAELEPWLLSHAIETRRMRAACELLHRLAGAGSRVERALAVFGFETRARAAPAEAAESYGARRVLYPQLASLREEDARFGPDPALFLDGCLADEVVRLAEARAAAALGLVVRRPTAPG